MAIRSSLAWDAVLATLFGVRAIYELLLVVRDPSLIGSHGIIYSDAARAWLTGGDPWSTGPAGATFAGPPTMLLAFAPFAFVPPEITRIVWLAGMVLVAIWATRRLRLPWCWLAFPPLLAAMVLGHPEVLVLALLLLRGPISGLASLVKPYAAASLLAERRWLAFVLAGGVMALSALLLPWGRFIDELPNIAAVLAAQSHGDSVFGNPVLMVVAGGALLALGPRRALWLAAPVLWPSAQPIYKVASIPALSRMLALFWAVPIPGATLAGVVLEAILVTAGRRRRLPGWLRLGLAPVGFAALEADARSRRVAPVAVPA